VSGLSETYTNQLNVMGNVGAVIYSTTMPSADLTVTPNGNISATGILNVGAYAVSGIVTDSQGNTGFWSFALTVVGPVSPGTSVTPIMAALPSGVEIQVPFQIDPTSGGVAILTDYAAIMAQHIETIILTGITERVMNPAYGFGAERMVFAPVNAGLPSLLKSDIITAIKTWEPRVQVQDVIVESSPTGQNILVITVIFLVIPLNDVNTVTVTTGGTIAQVNS
jgi:phage baseplate assembly protein W